MSRLTQPLIPSLRLGPPSGSIPPGANRARSGEAMELVISSMFHLSPGPKVGEVCPDAYNHLDIPVEIKSVKRGGKLVVYDFRLEKDAPNTLYFIGVHNRKPSRDISSIWEGLAATLQEVIILPLYAIRFLASLQPLCKTKTTLTKSGKRNGYTREGYAKGYRCIPYEWLKSNCLQAPYLAQCQIYNLQFQASIFISKQPLEVPNQDIL